MSHGVKYAKVIAMLGEATESVQAAFQQAILAIEDDKYLMSAREQFGCYYLAMNRYDKAKFQFEKAIETSRSQSYYYCHTANSGLKLISARQRTYKYKPRRQY